jgi:hypothetical protein
MYLLPADKAADMPRTCGPALKAAWNFRRQTLKGVTYGEESIYSGRIEPNRRRPSRPGTGAADKGIREEAETLYGRGTPDAIPGNVFAETGNRR